MKIKQLVIKFIMPFVQLYWRILKPKTFGVKGLVTNPTKTDEILLVRHNYGNRTLWNIPGGGYNPKQESSSVAVIRELREELDVSLLEIKEIGIYETTGEGKKDTVTIFSGTISSIDQINPNGEIAKIMWQNKNEVLIRDDVAKVAKAAIKYHYTI